MITLSKDGPAFPVQDLSKWQASGMSMRDYFAAKAMAVLLDAELPTTYSIRLTVDAAYEVADAMLEARK